MAQVRAGRSYEDKATGDAVDKESESRRSVEARGIYIYKYTLLLFKL